MPGNTTVKTSGKSLPHSGRGKRRNPHVLLHRVFTNMILSVIIGIVACNSGTGGTLQAMVPPGTASAGRSGLTTVDQRGIAGQSKTIDQIRIITGFPMDTRVIQSFLGEIKEGASFSPEVLQEQLIRVEERLINTTWFDRVAIYSVPLKDRPEFVKVIIEMEAGFPYRFWGGPHYAGAGWENIKGSGKSIGLELGYKHYYLSYTDHRWGPAGLFCQIALGSRYFPYTRHDGARTGAQKKGGSVFLGYKPNPDLLAGIAAEIFTLSQPGYDEAGTFQIGGRLLFDERNNTFSPTSGRYAEAYAGYTAYTPQGAAPAAGGYMLKVETRRYFPLRQDLCAAFRLQGVVQPAAIAHDALRFSLHGFQGMRAPFTEAMMAPVLLQAGGELRYRLLESNFFGFVNLAVEPAVVVDLGLAGGDPGKTLTAPAFLGAAGLALRLHFGAPVFLPLRLEIGWNQEGAAEVFFGIQEIF